MGMSYPNSTTKNFVAAEDIDQYRAVTIDGAGEISLAILATDQIMGITQDSVKAGLPVAVTVDGPSFAVVDATSAIVAGEQLTPSTDGLVGAASTNILAGTSLEFLPSGIGALEILVSTLGVAAP